MASDPDTIERDIQEARDALAATLDTLAERAGPRRMAEDGMDVVQSRLSDPRIKYPLIGVGVLVVLLLVRRLFR